MSKNTFKFRIKDRSTRRHLERHAIACNQVWNYCCQIQRQAERRYAWGGKGGWPSAFDLITLCVGTSKDLGIYSDTIGMVCLKFVASRNAAKRCPRFRKSYGNRRSLGWIPFQMHDMRLERDAIFYKRRKIRFWRSREILGNPKSGSIVQDARGRWYLAVTCDVEDLRQTGTGTIGVDLGLKSLATCSNGTTIPALRHYRRYEAALAIAQRARNKRRVAAIHAKIANARRHHLHEWSAKLARENAIIVVGNVNAAKLAKTRMAKSVLDASWTTFRNQLRYKASRHGAAYIEADERLTSQACSDCGAVGGPKGIAGLGVRSWECQNCGTAHDRDVNAARNILRIGLERQPPGVEIAQARGRYRSRTGPIPHPSLTDERQENGT